MARQSSIQRRPLIVRSKLEKFRPLAQVPGVQLYSLHKGKGIEQLPALAEEVKIRNLDPLISADFRDTAAAILNLDLVITIDTAVAHVAGALGVPVWILLPFNSDWRWLRDREDTIWYPSARLFRQTRWSDWDELFVRVAQALRERVQAPQEQGVAVRLSVQELVEKAIRDTLAAAPGSEPSWTVLRQAGVQQTPGLTRLVDSLGTAAQTLQRIETEMLTLAASTDLEARAPDLLRRYAQARQERHQLLEEVVSTVGSTGAR